MVQHAQLAANVVDTVILNADYPRVEVLSRDGTAAIFFTVDSDAPTVEGDNTHVIPAAISGISVSASTENGENTTVRLISSSTPKYTVRGLT